MLHDMKNLFTSFYRNWFGSNFFLNNVNGQVLWLLAYGKTLFQPLLFWWLWPWFPLFPWFPLWLLFQVLHRLPLFWPATFWLSVSILQGNKMTLGQPFRKCAELGVWWFTTVYIPLNWNTWTKPCHVTRFNKVNFRDRKSPSCVSLGN